METEKYKDWLMLNGKSLHTIQNYIWRIERVLSVIPEAELSQDKINAFLIELQKNAKSVTVNGYIWAITSYLKFIKKDIVLPKSLKLPKLMPKYFDEAYFLDKIIPMTEELIGKDVMKFKAIFYFLFYTGIRSGEIDTLKRSNIDLVNRKAKIYVSKTKEEREVYFNEATKSILQEYFDSEPEINNAFNMTVNGLHVRTKDFKHHLSEIHFHLHLFRSSFAVHCLRSGMQILSVSRSLGHKDIKTTMRYLGITDSDRQKEYNERIK